MIYCGGNSPRTQEEEMVIVDKKRNLVTLGVRAKNLVARMLATWIVHCDDSTHSDISDMTELLYCHWLRCSSVE
jgi:hypothetical protein